MGAVTARMKRGRQVPRQRSSAPLGGEVRGCHDRVLAPLKLPVAIPRPTRCRLAHQDDVAVGRRVHPHARRCPWPCRSARCPRRCPRPRAGCEVAADARAEAPRWASCARSSRASACPTCATAPRCGGRRSRSAREAVLVTDAVEENQDLALGARAVSRALSRLADRRNARQRDEEEQGAMEDLPHTKCIGTPAPPEIRAFGPLASSFSRMRSKTAGSVGHMASRARPRVVEQLRALAGRATPTCWTSCRRRSRATRPPAGGPARRRRRRRRRRRGVQRPHAQGQRRQPRGERDRGDLQARSRPRRELRTRGAVEPLLAELERNAAEAQAALARLARPAPSGGALVARSGSSRPRAADRRDDRRHRAALDEVAVGARLVHLLHRQRRRRAPRTRARTCAASAA